ncbi:MAG TPA: DEAD/DEAH box helicase, partial [Candidatus Norongarragalinales archaeon]|nr:DEAD/DEAH box helicase [Candidatus Norongarragalinales archaeon]
MAPRDLHPDVLHLAQLKGFAEFTEVQKKAFPKVLEKKDVLLIAPTGFGKTEAALLPILSNLYEEKGQSGVRVLYITPLRALNRDMLSRLEFYCGQLGLRLGVRHGDTSAYERTKQKAQPPDVLITTPESLNALLVFGMRDALKNVKFVVVDEVHELVYSKRGVSLSLALERLRLLTPFSVIGLSATVSAPADVAAFLSKSAEVVDCSHLRSLDLEAVRPRKGASVPGLSPETSARLGAIEALVRSHQKSLIFVNTRFLAEGLGALLRGILGEDVAVHHSSLSREARMEVEDAFKNGTLKALVCTSSLELGMDIGQVDLVIQIGSPRQVSRLVQRVGRSGHRKHLTPKGVVLCNDDIDFAEAQVLVRRAHAGQLEPQRMRSKALDVLAHHFCGLLLEYGPLTLGQGVKIFSNALMFRDLKETDLEGVVLQLSSEGLVAF